MVFGESTGRLIDFDFAGEPKMRDKHPDGYNREIRDGFRHPNAKSRCRLDASHDCYSMGNMLTELFRLKHDSGASKGHRIKFNGMFNQIAELLKVGQLSEAIKACNPLIRQYPVRLSARATSNRRGSESGSSSESGGSADIGAGIAGGGSSEIGDETGAAGGAGTGITTAVGIEAADGGSSTVDGASRKLALASTVAVPTDSNVEGPGVVVEGDNIEGHRVVVEGGISVSESFPECFCGQVILKNVRFWFKTFE